MITDSSFKIQIYEQIAKELNLAKIPHCAAHGIDYSKLLFGRDVDIMIRRQDRKRIHTIICSIFIKNNITFKINKFTWADWIIGYKENGDEQIDFIEIDLFYHIYYRLIEVTDPNMLGVSKISNHFYTNNWQTYAKVVLLKFFGTDLKLLHESKPQKYEEVQRVASLIKVSDVSSLFPQSLISNLNESIQNFDFKRIECLKKKYPILTLAKKEPLKLLKIFISCSIAAIDRKLHAFNITPVFVLPIDAKEIIAKGKSLIEKESFITCINESECKGSILSTYLRYRNQSEPLSLNIIYKNNVELSFVEKGLNVKVLKEINSIFDLIEYIFLQK